MKSAALALIISLACLTGYAQKKKQNNEQPPAPAAAQQPAGIDCKVSGYQKFHGYFEFYYY